MTDAGTGAQVADVAPLAVQVLDELLARRHSCRAFLPDPVPGEVLERLLTLAQRTPSWCNTQPWQVVLTAGEATERFRRALSAQVLTASPAPDFAFPPSYEGIYQDRRRECGLQLYEAVGVARGDRAASAEQGLKNFTFFGAPHVAVITSPASLGTYGAVDCGLYVQTFLLAAQALGLAAVPQAAVAGSSAFVREHLGIPDDRLVVCAVSFGYGDPEDPANGFRTSRAPLDQVVQFRV